MTIDEYVGRTVPNGPCTVEEALSERQALESKILAAVREFESKVGLMVRTIYTTKIQTMGGSDRTAAIEVNVELSRR